MLKKTKNQKRRKRNKTRRDKANFPDLDPKYNLRSRLDLLDQDYLDKLTPKELQWLNQFNKEYISASLNKENPRKNLHKNKKLRKDCYDRNNSRNRDILTKAKAAKLLTDYEELIEQPNCIDYEDLLINELDKKEARNAIDWIANQLDKDDCKLENELINELKDKKK